MRKYLFFIVVSILWSANPVHAVNQRIESRELICSFRTNSKYQFETNSDTESKSQVLGTHETGKNNPNKRGFISTLLGVSGFLTMWFGNPLGIFFALVGLPISIVGIVKDKNKTLAFVGLALNALMLACYMLAIYYSIVPPT